MRGGLRGKSKESWDTVQREIDEEFSREPGQTTSGLVKRIRRSKPTVLKHLRKWDAKKGGPYAKKDGKYWYTDKGRYRVWKAELDAAVEKEALETLSDVASCLLAYRNDGVLLTVDTPPRKVMRQVEIDGQVIQVPITDPPRFYPLRQEDVQDLIKSGPDTVRPRPHASRLRPYKTLGYPAKIFGIDMGFDPDMMRIDIDAVMKAARRAIRVIKRSVKRKGPSSTRRQRLWRTHKKQVAGRASGDSEGALSGE